MYCSNCGKPIEDSKKFCSNCGSSVVGHAQHNPHREHSTTKSELESKPWYRFLKVVYIIIAVVIFILAGLVSWLTMPHQTLDGENSSIVCYNGKSYAPNKNDIYVSGDSLDYSDDQNARILCQYNTTDYYIHLNENVAKNYTFNPVYLPLSYSYWLLYSALAFWIIWVFFVLLRVGFFYIAVGKQKKP